MTNTHGGPDWLDDCPPLPPSFGSPAERRNQPNTHTKYTHTTTLRLRLRLPPGTVTSGLLQPATDGHFRFPDSIWKSRGGTSGSPRSQALLSWGTTRKSAAPNSEFLGRDGQGRPRWEGAEHPEEPPPSSPEGAVLRLRASQYACVHS